MSKREKIEKVNDVNILLISDTKDYTTDYIAVELEKRHQSYLRIDKDKLSEYKVHFDFNNLVLLINKKSVEYLISDSTLRSIYYRVPTYLRETFSRAVLPEDQLSSSQWMAFIRNLTVFERAIWVNNPISSYKAENKLFQLLYAKIIGFNIPNTYIVNYCDNCIDSDEKLIVKSLDTAILKIGDKEGFAYSNVISRNELKNYDLSISPIVLQEYLYPKIDLRVTVIGEKVYAVKITKNDKGVEGDWRKLKNDVDFIPVTLPIHVTRNCIEIVKALDLNFGGIDLIESKGLYYFIEINPTGEWAWLVNSSNLPIYEGICDFLTS
jgi:glutathione synthase/RimK-type ligase-like ATP-grasp enzyme